MPLPADLQLGYVTSIDDCLAMKRWLSEDRGREILGLDLETSGLDPYAPGARIRMIQIGDGRTGWAVPWERWGGAAMECLRAWPGRLAVHNAAFEAQWFARFAKDWTFPWERVHDVLLHTKIMRPGQPADLKTASTRLVDRRAGVGQRLLDSQFKANGWDWDTVPLDLPAYHDYAALDPVLTVLLWEQLRADVHYPDVFDLEMGARRVCTQMQINGARLDVDYCTAQLEALTVKVDAGKKWAAERLYISGPKGQRAVKLGSPADLVQFFTKTLGQEITEFSAKTGNPSVNKVQLAKFVDGPDPRAASVARFIATMRYAERLKTSYFANFLKLERDGLIHCGINTMGAITARMSIQSPSLQNLPKNDPLVRGGIIPREGHKIISSDLDQVEFRLFACLANDTALIQAFRDADSSGSDSFTEIGRQVYNDPTMDKKDPRRAIIKTYIYSMLFGAGIEKQAKSAKVTVAAMQEFARTIKAQYPGMERFQQSIYDAVGGRAKSEKEGYVITPTTGRRLPIEEDKPYKGVNYTIQSSAADIFKTNLLELEARGLLPYLLVPVHDEIVLDVPEDLIADVGPVLHECMTTESERWALPLTAGLDGPFERWGQKNQLSLDESLRAGTERQLEEATAEADESDDEGDQELAA